MNDFSSATSVPPNLNVVNSPTSKGLEVGEDDAYINQLAMAGKVEVERTAIAANLLSTPPAPPSGGGPDRGKGSDPAPFVRREIDIGDRQLHEIITNALSAITDKLKHSSDHPILYVRNGALTRVTRLETGVHSISPVTEKSLQPILSDVADWIKTGYTTKGEPRKVNQFPPASVISSLVNLGEWEDVPALERVVSAPVFAGDGTLHDQPGYNPKTRLYYAGGVTLGDTIPTHERVQWAKSLILDDLLHDFPFVDEASKAHAVAMLILPFVRPMIDGPTPLHLIDTPTPGTGKGLLVDACALPSLGRSVPTMSAPTDEAEWRKILTTMLKDGDSHVCIDNINEKLDSGALASALTQPVWKDRLLQHTESVTMPIKTVWTATGNNVFVSDEIARRCAWIRLDANVEKPWEKENFKHKNLIAWATENRDTLATAVIVLVRSWVEAGQPMFTGRSKGSYHRWAGVIGGILQNAGIPGFLENEAKLFDKVATKLTLMTEFVQAWAVKYGLNRVGSGDLFKLASYSDNETDNKVGDWRNLLGELIASTSQRGRQTRFGNHMNEYIDRVVGEYKITLAGSTGGQKFYQLRPPEIEIEL
jgi:putative DNA primase/helicase